MGERSPPSDFFTDPEDEGTNTNNGYNCEFKPTSSSILEGDNCPANSDNLADGLATYTSYANKYNYMATNWWLGNQSPPSDFVCYSENGHEPSTSYSAENNSNEPTQSFFRFTKRLLNERSPDDDNISLCDDDTDMIDDQFDDGDPSDGDLSDDGHTQRSYVRPSSAQRCNNLHSQPHRRSDELRRTGSSKARSDPASSSQIRDSEAHFEDLTMKDIHDIIAMKAPSKGMTIKKIRSFASNALPPKFGGRLTKGYACCEYVKKTKRYTHNSAVCTEERSGPLKVRLRQDDRWGQGIPWDDDQILKMITLKRLHGYSTVAKILNTSSSDRRVYTAQSVCHQLRSVVQKYLEGDILSSEIKEEMSTVHREEQFHSIVAKACDVLQSPTKQNIKDYVSRNYPEWDWDISQDAVFELRCFEIVTRGGLMIYLHDKNKCSIRRMFSFFDHHSDDEDLKKAAKMGRLTKPAKKKQKTGDSNVASVSRLSKPRPQKQRKTFVVPQAPVGVHFFRSVSKRALQPGEVISESEDDSDDTWMYLRKHAEIDKACIPETSKRFLKLFDDFIHKENLHGDIHVGDSIIRFAQERGVQMWRDDVVREFEKKLNELFIEYSIPRAVLRDALKIVSEQKVDILEDNELSQRPAECALKSRPAKKIGLNPGHQTCSSPDQANVMYHSVCETNKNLAPKNDGNSKDQTIVAKAGYLTPLYGNSDGDVDMGEASLEITAELLGTTHGEDENVDLPYGLCYCDADASKASEKSDSITCANIVGLFLAISCTRPY